jgi:hypothetical protein
MAIQHPFTSGSHWRAPTSTHRVTPLLRASGQPVARRLPLFGGALAAAALALVTLGGVFAAPVAALVALAAMLMPRHDIAHAVAGPLIVGAVIWLALAILCAHARAPLASWRRRAGHVPSHSREA